MIRKLLFALCAMLMILPLLAAQKERKFDPWYRLGRGVFLGSVAADLGTTVNPPPGRIEANPLLGNNKTQQIAIGVGIGTLIMWNAHYLETRGYRKLAKVLLWTGSACHWSATICNARRR